jgi:hypothetical protein
MREVIVKNQKPSYEGRRLLMAATRTTHSSHDPGGSVGRGPSHQVSFFFFFLPSFLFFLFCLYFRFLKSKTFKKKI